MKKIYTIGGAVIVALFLFLWLILPLFFNTDEIKNEFIATIESETNIQAEIRGDVSLSIFPFGSLSAEDIALSKDGKRIGTADKIEVGFSFFNALTGNIKPDTITILNPEIKGDLEFNHEQSFQKIKTIIIENGTYKEFSEINAEVEIQDKIAEGELLYKNKKVEFNIAITNKNNLTANIKHKLASIYFDGEYKIYKGNLRINGQAETKFNDLKGLSDIVFKDNDIFDRYHLPKTLSLKGQIAYYKNRLILKEFYGMFGESRVGFSLDYPLKNRDINATSLSIGVDELNLDNILQNDTQKDELALRFQDWEIPKNRFIYTDFSIDKLIYNGKSINIQMLRADVTGGEITLQPSMIKFSGNNTATIFGVFGSGSTVDWDKKNNRRFDGKIEISGENLKELFLLAGADSFKNIPKNGLKDFNMSADLFITKDEFRLADIKAEFDDASLVGVIIADMKNGGKIDTTINVEGVDFDRYIPENLLLFKPDVAEEKKKDFIDAFSWIQDLKANMKLSSKIRNSQFKNRKFSTMEFDIKSQKGQVEFEKLNIVSDDLKVSGNGRITVSGGVPNIEAKLVFDDINTADFWDTKINNEPFIGDKKWSKKPFDFHLLSQFNSQFDLSFESLKHHGYKFENLRIAGDLAAKKLDIKEITGEIWNGRFAIATVLTTHNVSSISSSFKLHNMNVQPILKFLFGMENITGVGNINGKLQTSGINPYSWVYQSNGTVSISARPLVLQGFTLQSIAMKISRLRTVADIVNISRLAFKSGKTYFEDLTGRIVIQGGKLFSPLPLNLKSKSANGNISVKMNLLDGQVDILSQFALNVSSCDVPAILKIRQKGALKKMKKVVDTKLLEDYVAKCSATRMLNR